LISLKSFIEKIRNIWNGFKTSLKKFVKRKKTIFIINNYPGRYKSERIRRLENLIQLEFPTLKAKIIHYSDIDKKTLKKSIGLILTGSSLNVSSFSSNPSMEARFIPEIELIRKYKKPILAICFGHQLAAYAFGAKVKRMSYRAVNNDIFKLELQKSDELITTNEIHINLNHKDYVVPYDENLRKHFDINANLSVDGYETVQYMKHKKKPIYSVQFHPENHIGNFHYPPYIEDEIIDKAKIAGQILISNFVSLCL
jgi:GMP synthase-like glutamine amidotransferase